MSMEEILKSIVTIVKELGIQVGIIIWFMVRDWKWSAKGHDESVTQTRLMTKIVERLNQALGIREDNP